MAKAKGRGKRLGGRASAHDSGLPYSRPTPHLRPMDLDPPDLLWLLAAAFAALAALAGWADSRRARRRDVDRPGFVPWQPILVLALMASVVSLALALIA